MGCPEKTLLIGKSGVQGEFRWTLSSSDGQSMEILANTYFGKPNYKSDDLVVLAGCHNESIYVADSSSAEVGAIKEFPLVQLYQDTNLRDCLDQILANSNCKLVLT